MAFAIALTSIGLLLLVCAIFSKVLYKFGVPILLVFLGLGLLIGGMTEGKLPVNNNSVAQQICTVAFMFIIFSGGFATRWKTARPIIKRAVWLSTVGVFLTAAVVGLFAYLLFPKIGIAGGLLLGAIVGSTDSASVFGILRSKNMNLKGSLAPTLEVESGSNDPMAFMLTIIMLTIVMPDNSVISSPILNGLKSILPLAGFVPILFVMQIAVGLGVGFGLSVPIAKGLKKVKLDIEGFYPIILIAVVIFGYGFSDFLGGNGLLTLYVAGLVLGNTEGLPQKRMLVRFFDGLGWLAQILMFVSLGILAYPELLLPVALPSIVLAVVITLIARPLAVFAILTPFKVPVKEQVFISWVGFRGAASIVFAILPLIAGYEYASDLFHVVFCMAVVSIVLQGTLMPVFAKKLNLTEEGESVLSTFTDYPDEAYDMLVELIVGEDSKMKDRTIAELGIPHDVFIVLIKRKSKTITPKGSTILQEGDKLLLSSDDADNFMEVKQTYHLYSVEQARALRRKTTVNKPPQASEKARVKEFLHIEIVHDDSVDDLKEKQLAAEREEMKARRAAKQAEEKEHGDGNNRNGTDDKAISSDKGRLGKAPKEPTEDDGVEHS